MFSWDVSMSKKGKLLGSTTITNSYSITIIKKCRKYLNVKIGDVLGFFRTGSDDIIMTRSQIGQTDQDLDLLGSSTLTTSNTLTLPKKVREILQVGKGDNIAYYEGRMQQIILSI